MKFIFILKAGALNVSMEIRIASFDGISEVNMVNIFYQKTS